MLAKTIAVTSGKGGVGKTYCSINLCKEFARIGKKVLLVDCDFNLSNCAVTLGVKQERTILDYYRGIPLENCINNVGDFDLLVGESGNLGVLNVDKFLPGLILDFLPKVSKNYDYIFFDMPAGLDLTILNLTSYCDHRFVVVSSSDLSVTDAYALIKILGQKYGVTDHFILPNMIANSVSINSLKSKLENVVSQFLDSRISFLPQINLVDSHFRQANDGSKLEKISGQKDFYQVVDFFLDQVNDRPSKIFLDGGRQDVFFSRLRSS